LTDLIGERMILFRRDIPFGTMAAQACQQANVELESIVDVTRADQALALVKGRLGLEIVDEFAAHAQDLIIRPLIEEVEPVSTFVYSKFPALSQHGAPDACGLPAGATYEPAYHQRVAASVMLRALASAWLSLT